MSLVPAPDPSPDAASPATGVRPAAPASDGVRESITDRGRPAIEIVPRRAHRPTVVARDRGTLGAIRASDAPDAGACPFVERNDARCARRLRLGSIDDAFTYCFGGYRACATYQHLTGGDEGPPAPVRITVRGHAVTGPARAGTA